MSYGIFGYGQDEGSEFMTVGPTPSGQAQPIGPMLEEAATATQEEAQAALAPTPTPTPVAFRPAPTPTPTPTPTVQKASMFTMALWGLAIVGGIGLLAAMGKKKKRAHANRRAGRRRRYRRNASRISITKTHFGYEVRKDGRLIGIARTLRGAQQMAVM